ncbi:hypothetical protein I7I53_03694 [Histoplasma capsulatum var. duboisii H88]|uniref:Secreted protein n=1 Tax=Ajellomyces capsulatus (strain H88) TaxID=544711 RepID=A0A8A1LRH4_AJEC8|nr:hypothetical protein I7I53_03694 [Histoplasma capsulatum var. duboisii H88]
MMFFFVPPRPMLFASKLCCGVLLLCLASRLGDVRWASECPYAGLIKADWNSNWKIFPRKENKYKMEG